MKNGSQINMRFSVIYNKGYGFIVPMGAMAEPSFGTWDVNKEPLFRKVGKAVGDVGSFYGNGFAVLSSNLITKRIF